MRKINIEELIGKKFGRLTVLSLNHSVQNIVNGKNWGNVYYLRCLCDCGNECIIQRNKLIDGNTKSCGCIHREMMVAREYKHGMVKTRIYKCYHDMKSRCYRKTNKDYYNYGKRGIKVCKEWLDKDNGFITFKDWALDNDYNDSLTLDRIDSNKDYSPDNCRWSNIIQQANNRNNNNRIQYKGKIYTVAELSRETNISYRKLLYRVQIIKKNNILDIDNYIDEIRRV